jgi:CHAT domain-containing protein
MYSCNVLHFKLVAQYLKQNPPTNNPLHVWWSLTGPLAFLPIHAAGLYGAAQSSVLGCKLSDYVVSSYTPSLTALIEGSRPRGKLTGKPKLLAIALPLESRLPCVKKEIDILEKHAKGHAFSKLMESDATVQNVVEGMKESNWVHFACHGVQEITDPTKSALLLAKGAHLTLLDMSKLSLPHAELAYLSACQTATGVDELSEEAVHLTAGMLSAGYHGVIGTMWSINDEDAPKVADAVYTHLFKDKDSNPDPTQAAFALHEAVKKLRDESGAEKSLFSWVPYIHVGI